VWPVVPINAGLTVDPRGVLQAIDADASSLELPCRVQASLLTRDTFIIVTVFGFVVTITF
jgi:hypothetical protein